MKTYALQRNHIFATIEPTRIQTVVGNAVVVCLWDPVTCVGGMCHYSLAKKPTLGKPTAQYGNVALSHLYKTILEMEADKQRIVAHLFGGAQRPPEHFEKTTAQMYEKNNVISARNIAFAHHFCKQKVIPIYTADTGGFMGRKIVFDTSVGESAVLKVHALRLSDWSSTETE